MAWSFGDSFDLYSSLSEAVNGYWDLNPSATSIGLANGRFAGSRCVRFAGSGNSSTFIAKTSAVNDAVHHIVLSFKQDATISGSSLGAFVELFDGATAQCSVVFRSDGAILLVSGAPSSGTTLATYANAFPVTNIWYAFELEIVINNTTGSFTVRRNGNPSNDFTLGSLNTRGGTTNNYANKLQIGQNESIFSQYFDDLFWRSDTTSVAWLGDIRCYARMPTSDVSVQFSHSPATFTETIDNSLNVTPVVTQSYYSGFTATYDGTVDTVILPLNVGWTGNAKCSVFASTGGFPGAIIASAPTIVNPVAGNNSFIFSPPFTVVEGVQYWVGFAVDTALTNSWGNTAGAPGQRSSVVGYSTFPTATPSVVGYNAIPSSWIITLTSNHPVVNEPQQDALTSYVYDSTAGHADFYNVGAIGATPSVTFAVVTRGYMQKSDVGSRTAAVRLKSGSTTVASPTMNLTTSGWQWAWRQDLVDPNTSAAWTATAVNNVQIGPIVIS